MNDLDEAVKAVERVGSIDRRTCRKVFEERFSVRRMASDYLALYNQLNVRRPELVQAPDSLRAA